MSRFNTQKPTSATVNRAGGKAYKQTSELALASLLLTSFLQNKYYESGTAQANRLVKLVEEVDPKFAAQAAIYARNEFGMRSTSHVVAAAVREHIKGTDWAKRFFEKVIRRPDDITEILSITGKEHMTHAMRKGFAAALANFDDYQLGKYKMAKKNVKMVDAVNLTHAYSPSVSRLVKGTLKAPETFETKLSASGNAENVEEAKADAWRELLETRKIGYFALLKNLRNIEQQAPELVSTAAELLQDEKLIRNSLVLPFRYLTAYNEVSSREFKQAISRAIDIACANVPKFDGKTLIAIDDSGSMNGRNSEIASLFGAIMYKAMDADILMFSDRAQQYTPNPDDSVMTIAKGMPYHGGGTYFNLIFKAIKPVPPHYNRIFILSDMQSWMESQYWGESVQKSFRQYQKINPEVKLYSFDLDGQGDMQFPEQNVFTCAGWSEKVFDVIKRLEEGQNLVDQIRQVEI